MSQKAEGRPLEGKKIVFVVAPNEYRDEELDVPLKMVEEAGAVTSIASPKTGRCQGMLGGQVEAKLATSALHASEWDAAVVVGGMGSPEYLWTDKPLLDFLAKLDKAGKPIGGICLSGAVLANAGVLKGRVATVWPEPKAIDALVAGGARYEKAPVQVDGTIVTGEGPHAAEPFAEKLLEVLARAAAPVR